LRPNGGDMPESSSTASDFVRTERLRRAPVVRYAIILALLSLLGTTVQNLGAFASEAAVIYTRWAIALALNLLAIYVFSSSLTYSDKRWLDLPLSLPMILWMDGIRVSMLDQSIGWTPVATTTGNFTLGIVFVGLFFPANFRAYVAWVAVYFLAFWLALERLGIGSTEKMFAWGVLLPIAAVSIYNAWASDMRALENFKLTVSLDDEKKKSEEMLFSILPEEVANRLRAGHAVADAYSDATVVFVDLIGSSKLARNLSPRYFLGMLNDVFSVCDRGAALFGVEKVKTIGDAYLAVAGGRSGGDAFAALSFAKFVVEQVQALARERQLELGVRVGIHTGPVVGGVIGRTRATYDYWGDTMNVAARVEAAAEPGGISVTTQTYFATRDRVDYLPPRTVMLKGIGDTQIYDVAGEPIG
jgi:adenylate cyclase